MWVYLCVFIGCACMYLFRYLCAFNYQKNVWKHTLVETKILLSSSEQLVDSNTKRMELDYAYILKTGPKRKDQLRPEQPQSNGNANLWHSPINSPFRLNYSSTLLGLLKYTLINSFQTVYLQLWPRSTICCTSERMSPKINNCLFNFHFSPLQYKRRGIGAARRHAIYQGRPGTTTIRSSTSITKVF